MVAFLVWFTRKHAIDKTPAVIYKLLQGFGEHMFSEKKSITKQQISS